jgi:itaconyl-CoA hydratase
MRYLDDFAAGDRYDHRGRRVAIEADRVWFASLTMNQHELHVGASDGPGVLPVGWTLAVLVGLAVEDVSAAATANLGWEAEFGVPVRVGDELRASSEVLAVDIGAGTVEARTRGESQRGETVAVLTRVLAIPARPQGE